MKKALLILRIPVETAFGLLYMSGLLLLPKICRGVFPQILLFGFLGLIRFPSPAARFYFNAIAGSIGLFLVMFLVANGLLWFKDVRDIIRELRTRRQA